MVSSLLKRLGNGFSYETVQRYTLLAGSLVASNSCPAAL